MAAFFAAGIHFHAGHKPELEGGGTRLFALTPLVATQ